jgi:hypothetical protein
MTKFRKIKIIGLAVSGGLLTLSFMIYVVFGMAVGPDLHTVKYYSNENNYETAIVLLLNATT